MIQVINRAIDILELLSRNIDQKLGLGDIANHLELNHSTCANIIKTLINRGYVEKENGYRLGPKAFYLGGDFSSQSTLLFKAMESLKLLNQTINEACILAVLRENIRITLHKEMSEHELQATTRDEKNAYLTATGRVLIANMNDQEKLHYIKKYGLPKGMWPEVLDHNDLLTKLSNIVTEGIAIHYAESEIVGIAVALTQDNIVHASIGIYLPISRFTDQKKDFLIKQLKKTANEINSSMVYSNILTREKNFKS